MLRKFLLSVVIPTKNRLEDLEESVKSIISQNYLPDELLVMDQSDSSNAKEMLEKLLYKNPVKLVYLYNPEIPGLTHARNESVRKSSGDIIFFLDDDVIVPNNCINEIMKFFNNDEKGEIGGISPIIKPLVENFKDKIVFCTIFYRGPFREVTQRAGSLKKRDSKLTKLIPTTRLTGCSAYRREIFDKYCFDENFADYSLSEDMVFSYVVSREYKLFLAPHIKIYHKRSSVTHLSRRRFCTMQIYTQFYFFKKYLPKTIQNIISYLLLNLGYSRYLLNIYHPSTIIGTVRGFCLIMDVLLKRVTLEEQLKDL